MREPSSSAGAFARVVAWRSNPIPWGFVGGVVGLVGTIIAIADAPVLVNVEAPRAAVVEASPRVLADTPGGVELAETLTIAAGAATQIQLSSGREHLSYHCTNTTTTPVYSVSPGATTAAEVGGPFCATSTCGAGPVWGAKVRKAYAIAPAGATAVNCRFVVP